MRNVDSVTGLPDAWFAGLHRLRNALANDQTASRAAAVCWALTRLILVIQVVAGHSYADPEFYQYAGLFATGHWPYTNFPVEYPPLAMVFILAPALPLLLFKRIAPLPDPGFTGTFTHLPTADPVRYGAYAIVFATMILAVDAATTRMVWTGARRFIASDPTGAWSAMTYIWLIFLNGALLQKFDLVAGTLVLIAVLSFANHHQKTAWAALALATLVKGYPILAVPFFAILTVYDTRPECTWNERLRRLVPGVVSFSAVIAAFTGIVLLFAGFRPIVETVLYHADRGTEVESIFANLMMLVSWLPGLAAHTVFHQADLSRNITSLLDPWVAPFAYTMLALTLAASYVGALKYFRAYYGTNSGHTITVQRLLVPACAVFLAFMLSFRALPLHYFLGILPLIALVRLPSQRLHAIWLLSIILTQLAGQFVVSFWHNLVVLQPATVALLTVRNSAWTVAFFILLVALWRKIYVPGRLRQVE